MTKTLRRGLSMLLVLAMCLSFLPMITVNSDASDISYVYDGKYIYNWGTRGEEATELSPNAEAFYSGSYSYENLSSYSGGTGKSDAPNSALFKALQTLMTNAHSYKTSYDATKSLYKYTDCENSGGKISSFYSGKAIGPSWDGGWNREHTWPNSKGLGGSDENDIMMLRPTSTSENSSRGNTAYGKSSGYYNPNSESGGKYDLRGDVARIFLYVYVRWGNVNGNGQYSTWGSSGVMESVEVLLEWMEADPVDTWELGRNDSVQSITGTRNVFVDYPELAFTLFGEEIPEGMSTPSGSGDGKCDHNNFDSGVIIAATCTANGYTVYTCMTSGCTYSYKTNTVSAKGHSFSSGKCSVCGESEPVEPYFVTSPSTGVAYKLGFLSTSSGNVHYFTGSMSTSNSYYGATDTSFANGVDIFVESVSGGYRMYFKNSSGAKQYINLVVSGTHRNFTFSSTATSTFTWDSAKNAMKTVLEGEDVYIGNYGSYTNVGTLQSSKLKDTDYIARLYTMSAPSGGEGGGEDAGDTTCKHSYSSVVTAPSCTKEGFTTYTCTLCGDSYKGNTVAAKGHSYNNGSCTVCGAVKPSSTTLKITFDDKANRTVFTTSQQVWVMNGITVTNNKASASSNVADYVNPVRFYQGSDVIIACKGMTKIEIDCSGLESKYVTSWLNVSGATATNNNGIVTVAFNSAVDSFTYTSLLKQSRAKSITVYVEAEATCSHTNTVISGASAASCTKDGHTGVTSCTACGEVIDAGKVIPKKGHTAGAAVGAKAPTCTEDGHTGVSSCTVCGVVVNAGEVVPMLGHDLGGFSQVKAPGCTEKGLERADCENCDHYVERDVPALGHSDEDKDELCDNCGTDLSDGTETPENPDVPGDSDDELDSPELDEIKYIVAVAVVTVSIIVLIGIVCFN